MFKINNRIHIFHIRRINILSEQDRIIVFLWRDTSWVQTKFLIMRFWNFNLKMLLTFFSLFENKGSRFHYIIYHERWYYVPEEINVVFYIQVCLPYNRAIYHAWDIFRNLKNVLIYFSFECEMHKIIIVRAIQVWYKKCISMSNCWCQLSVEYTRRSLFC